MSNRTRRSAPPPAAVAAKSRQQPSARHQLMRQQFYTNNERTSTFVPASQESSGQLERNAKRANLSPKTTGRHVTTTTTTTTNNKWSISYQLNLVSDSTLAPMQTTQSTTTTTANNNNNNNNHHHLQPVILTSNNSTTSSTWNDDDSTASPLASASAAAVTQQLSKECLQQYNLAYHSASPSIPSGGRSMGSPSGGGGDALNFADCVSAGDNSTTLGAGSLPIDCGDQFALMNIRTEELNFADTEQVWLLKSWPEILARVSCVTPIVLLGLIGNLTIIYSMCRFKPIRSKPTNVFILNMAIADLLTTIVCPNAALLTDIYQFYVMGAFVCRTEGFIKITCLLVSAYSLIVLSFDWFLSVVKPCRTRITIKQSWLTLVAIWLVSVSMASPLLHWRRLRERQWKDITEIWCCELIQYTKYYWVGITLFLIYLPTFVMTIVLIVILARMDRFEAKLRRSRRRAGHTARNGLDRPRPPSSSLTMTGNPSTASGAGGGGGGGGGALSTSSFAANQHNHHHLSSAPSNSTRISIATTLSNNHNQTTTTNTSNNRWLSQSTGGGGAGQVAASSRGERQLNSSLTLGMKYRRRIVKILFFYLLTSIVCWTPLQFTIIYRHFRSEPVPAGWFFELTFYSQLCASLSGAMNPIIFGFLSQPFRRVVTKSWMFRFLDKVWRSRSDAGDGGDNHRRHPPAANAMVNLATPIQRNGAMVARQQVVVEQEPKLNIDYVEHRSDRQLAKSSRQSEIERGARTPTTTSRSHNHNQDRVAVERSRSQVLPVSGGGGGTRTSATSVRHKRVSFNSKTSGGLENAAYNDEEEEEEGAPRTTSFIVPACHLSTSHGQKSQNGTHSGQEEQTKK